MNTSIIEDSILDPFTDHILKRAAEKGLPMELVKECLRAARMDMRDDSFVRTMEAALEGIAGPSPMFQVSDRVAIFTLADPKDPPAVGEKVGFKPGSGIVRAKNGVRARGVLLSIEPGGLTAQVVMD